MLFFMAAECHAMFPPLPADTAGSFTLDQCIRYALQNDYTIRQARTDEQIGEHEIKANLAGWFPQISAQYNLTHNFRLPTSAFGENLITIGRKNNSNILFQANQAIFSNDLLLATRAGHYNRIRLQQNTESERINTVVEVTKTFFDILLIREQLKILEENITRQEKQREDAYNRYEFGLVDKTDYQRAGISLANSRIEKKRTGEILEARYAYLKQLMGYPASSPLNLRFDMTSLEQQALADTNQTLNYSNRIEIKQLEVQRQLYQLNTSYYRLGFLPTVSAFVNYNFVYMDNELSRLYRQSYPTSQGGVSIALPIFQGTRRWQNVRIAELSEERIETESEYLRAAIHTEYQTALANYKGNYYEWVTLRQSVETAKEVYEVIKLQYDEGIKAYVDLIIAETDLKSAQLNYYNALYRLMASKIDLEKALGTIEVNP